MLKKLTLLTLCFALCAPHASHGFLNGFAESFGRRLKGCLSMVAPRTFDALKYNRFNAKINSHIHDSEANRSASIKFEESLNARDQKRFIYKQMLCHPMLAIAVALTGNRPAGYLNAFKGALAFRGVVFEEDLKKRDRKKHDLVWSR